MSGFLGLGVSKKGIAQSGGLYVLKAEDIVDNSFTINEEVLNKIVLCKTSVTDYYISIFLTDIGKDGDFITFKNTEDQIDLYGLSTLDRIETGDDAYLEFYDLDYSGNLFIPQKWGHWIEGQDIEITFVKESGKWRRMNNNAIFEGIASIYDDRSPKLRSNLDANNRTISNVRELQTDLIQLDTYVPAIGSYFDISDAADGDEIYVNAFFNFPDIQIHQILKHGATPPASYNTVNQETNVIASATERVSIKYSYYKPNQFEVIIRTKAGLEISRTVINKPPLVMLVIDRSRGYLGFYITDEDQVERIYDYDLSDQTDDWNELIIFANPPSTQTFQFDKVNELFVPPINDETGYYIEYNLETATEKKGYLVPTIPAYTDTQNIYETLKKLKAGVFSGTVKAADPVDATDVVNKQYFEANLPAVPTLLPHYYDFKYKGDRILTANTWYLLKVQGGDIVFEQKASDASFSYYMDESMYEDFEPHKDTVLDFCKINLLSNNSACKFDTSIVFTPPGVDQTFHRTVTNSVVSGVLSFPNNITLPLEASNSRNFMFLYLKPDADVTIQDLRLQFKINKAL